MAKTDKDNSQTQEQKKQQRIRTMQTKYEKEVPDDCRRTFTNLVVKKEDHNRKGSIGSRKTSMRNLPKMTQGLQSYHSYSNLSVLKPGQLRQDSNIQKPSKDTVFMTGVDGYNVSTGEPNQSSIFELN